MYLWRADNDKGEVLDVLDQKRRNAAARTKIPWRLEKKQGVAPETTSTDKLASYAAAAHDRDAAWIVGSRSRSGTVAERTGFNLPQNGVSYCGGTSQAAKSCCVGRYPNHPERNARTSRT